MRQKNNKIHIVSIRLSDEDFESLQKYCKRFRISKSRLISKLLFQFLKWGEYENKFTM